MLTFSKSYIYESIIDKNSSITNRIRKTVGGTHGDFVVNDELAKSVSDMVRFYKDPVVVQAAKAISEKRILLMVLPVEYQLPACLPFVKYRMKGSGTSVYIDVSKYVITREIGENVELSMDAKKLYALTYSAYVTLELIEPTTIFSGEISKWSAYVWSKMFCKVLNQAIGLSTDADRYDAFMYYCMKFFCLHILELPVPLTDQIAEGMTPHYADNYVIKNMQNVISTRNYPVFASIADFCKTMFTDEVSNLKGIKIANVQDRMNIAEYFKKFMIMYGPASVMSLGAYPYFLFVAVASYVQSMIVNDRSLKDIIKEDENKGMIKLMVALEKELQ